MPAEASAPRRKYHPVSPDPSRQEYEREGTLCQIDLQTYKSINSLVSTGADSCAANYEPYPEENWNEMDDHNLQRFQSRASTLIDSSSQPETDKPRLSTTIDFIDTKQSISPPPEGDAGLFITRGEKKYQPPWFLVGSVMAIMVLTAGLATVMVLWIHWHRLPLESEGVIFVREGVEDEPDRLYTSSVLGSNNTMRFNTQIAHSTGLSFSTITSTLVQMSLFPFMSLIAYSLGTDWLIMQARVAESPSVAMREKLPTPMQYALLLQICSSQSIDAALATLRHIFFGRGSRASVPSLLKKAVTWLIILLTINIAIVWTDFWLHETVKIVQLVHINPKPRMEAFGSRLNATRCQALEVQLQPPCLTTINASNGAFEFGNDFDADALAAQDEGVLTFLGLSDEHQLADLGSEDQLSRSETYRQRFSPPLRGDRDTVVFATSPGVKGSEVFKAPTIAIDTECEMITSRCSHSSNGVDCSNVGHPELNSGTTPALASRMQIFPNGRPPFGNVTELLKPANPIEIDVLLNYIDVATPDVLQTGFQAVRQDGFGSIYSAASCKLSFYEVHVDYFNSSFSIEGNKTLAPAELAYQLSGPLLSGKSVHPIAPALSAAAGKTPHATFGNELAYSLSYSTLASASGLLEPVKVSVLDSELVLASQYPLIALQVYFGLLYSYALLALILFVWAWSSSSDSITYNCPTTGKSIQIPAATLTQKVLMNPGRLIAAHLGGSQTHAHGSTLASVTAMLAHATPGLKSTEDMGVKTTDEGHSTGVQRLAINRQAAIRTTSTDLLDLFDEPVHQERLVVGLESSGRGFGVWPLSQASGAIGRSTGRKRDSMVRASNPFHHMHRSHYAAPNEGQQQSQRPINPHEVDQDFAPAQGQHSTRQQ